jgi:hypothetical protein
LFTYCLSNGWYCENCGLFMVILDHIAGISTKNWWNGWFVYGNNVSHVKAKYKHRYIIVPLSSRGTVALMVLG